MALNKITDAQITAHGVVSAPDVLTGTAAENKALFDRLITNVVAVYFNELIDKLTVKTGADEVGAQVKGFSATTVGGVLDALKAALDEMDTTVSGLVKRITYADGLFIVTFEDGSREFFNIATQMNQAIAKAEDAAAKAEAAAENAEAIVGGDFVTTPVMEAALETKAGKSAVIETTLLANRWSNGLYTLAVDGVTVTSNQEVLPSQNITAEQLEALQVANIQDGGQKNGSVSLKAFGDVPTVDIPVRIIVRGDA